MCCYYYSTAVAGLQTTRPACWGRGDAYCKIRQTHQPSQNSPRREKISGEISRLEERKIAVQSDYDGVVRQLMEQYELSVSEAQQAAQPLEDLQAAQRELQSLKAKIRALGTVNVAAISEYEEVFARYQFLTAQVQDAQKAKQELEDLIESLTTEMQRIFSESFSIINRSAAERHGWS